MDIPVKFFTIMTFRFSEERARQLSEARDSQAMLEMTVSKLRQEVSSSRIMNMLF